MKIFVATILAARNLVDAGISLEDAARKLGISVPTLKTALKADIEAVAEREAKYLARRAVHPVRPSPKKDVLPADEGGSKAVGYSVEFVEECLALLAAGMNKKEVAALKGVTDRTLRRWERDAGIEAHEVEKETVNPKILEEAVEAVLKGGFVTDVARKYGLSDTVLRSRVKECGLTLQRSQRYSEAFKGMIVARVKAGETQAEIEELFGVSRGVQRGWLNDAGVPCLTPQERGVKRRAKK